MVALVQNRITCERGWGALAPMRSMDRKMNVLCGGFEPGSFGVVEKSLVGFEPGSFGVVVKNLYGPAGI